MVESFLAVPLHFTVEFLGFLVFAGGAFLVVTRPGLVPGEVSNRVAVAVGFGILGLAQVLHGGAFSQLEELDLALDASQMLVAARTLGFAFVLVGIVGGLRAGAGAIALAGWSLEEPLLLAPAGAAIAVGTAAAIGARGDRGALRRLAAAAFLFGLAEVLTASAPEFQFGAGVVSGWAYAAHAAKALGFVALAAWFWTAARSSVRTRFVAAFAGLLVAVVLALASALTGVISSSVQNAELEDVTAQAKGTLEQFDTDMTRLSNDLGEISTFVSDELGTETLKDEVQRFRGIFEFDFLMVMNPRGEILAFAGEGPALGKQQAPSKLSNLDVLEINGSPVITTLLRGQTDAAAAPTQVARDAVALVAAHEINSPTPPQRRIGLVAAGNYIDTIDLVGIRARLGDEPFPSLVVQNRTVASRLPGPFSKRNLIPPEIRTQVAKGGTVARVIVVRGRSYASAFAPIRTPPPRRGTIATFVLSTPAEVVVDARQGITSVLFLVAMAVGAIALVLAWFSGRRITRPIQLLTQTAEEVREGNLRAEAPVSGEDEVGRLGETFNEMTTSLLKMTNDLREAAREEHDLRARIETIIQSMADGLLAVDADKNVLAFNREAERLTGIETSEAIGKPIREVLVTKDSHGNEAPLPIYDLAAGSVDNIFVDPRDGKPVPVTIVSAPLTDEDGAAAGGVLVMRDMTREREVERMKTEFLSNISHELRTPLTPIKGYAEILGRKDVPPEKAQKFVAGILESTSRLERIVHLLVDFSAMEAGRLSPKATPVDISNMVEELATEWGKRSDRHSVVTDIGQRVPQVAGDERLLRRSFEEVLDNAVKFSPYGGTIRLEVKGAAADNGGMGRDLVEISISDEGIGIPADDIPRIFSDFHQLDGSETRTFGGLGLGLAFVQRIIEAHDGSVTVESEPDHGTRLTIAIPAVSGGE